MRQNQIAFRQLICIYPLSGHKNQNADVSLFHDQLICNSKKAAEALAKTRQKKMRDKRDLTYSTNPKTAHYMFG